MKGINRVKKEDKRKEPSLLELSGKELAKENLPFNHLLQ